MFSVADIDELVNRLTKYGAELVGEIVQYENFYRLIVLVTFVGVEGILIGFA